MFGFGKKAWKRLTGISAAQRKLSRKIGIPLSRGGRQRKLGQQLGCSVMIAFALATALACGGAGVTEKEEPPPIPVQPAKAEPEPPRAAPVHAAGHTASQAHHTTKVDVHGYTRKDGTHVKPHTRSAPHR